jgi:hypothetical protein
MTITVSQITSLVGRYTNEVVNEQINSATPFVGKGILKKVVKKDKIGIVNVKAGELSSGGFIADGGTLPSGSDVQPVQGTYSPIGLFARISIPRIAASLASSVDDGIDIVKEEMDSCGKTIGRLLGRGIAGNSLGSPTATVNVASTTFTVASPGAWRVGMAFEVWNGASLVEGTSDATLLKVTNVAIPADGVGDTTVTFSGQNAGGNITQWTTGMTFFLRGGKSNAMTSMQDITAAASLYTISNATQDWSGNLDSNTTTLTVEAMRALMTTTVRRRGEKPTHVICNRRNEERYSNRLLNNRRFMSGKMDAVGGSAFEFEGLPVFTDENFDDTDLYFFNQNDVKLHVFREAAPDFDGGQEKGMNRAAVLVSDTQLIYDVQVLGIYNLRVERRNGTARMSALVA